MTSVEDDAEPEVIDDEYDKLVQDESTAIVLRRKDLEKQITVRTNSTDLIRREVGWFGNEKYS
jgi:hypothetical protein